MVKKEKWKYKLLNIGLDFILIYPYFLETNLNNFRNKRK